jgi:hypothetical protein
MNLAFKLIFLEGDHNHSLGENIEKCLNDVIEAQKGRQKKNIFSVLLPTLYLHRDRLKWGGYVSA